MATIYGTISGVSYAKITQKGTQPEEVWTVNPYDVSGNLIPEITIECDIKEGSIYINVPYTGQYNDNFFPNFYSTNGNTNFKLKIIRFGGNVNNLIVFSNGAMKFSGTVNPSNFALSNEFDSATITPIGTQETYQVLFDSKL